LQGAAAISPRSGVFVKTLAGDSLSEERLLAAAVRALHVDTDPRSALAALDEYGTHYPHGRLLVEAEVLRVDALAALKNTSEVLRILDGLDFSQMPGGLARQLQRGELRAAAGRYREAEADFANVLNRARSQDLGVLERALWGRAQSRAGLGDADGARTDANAYVRRFPSGRFAAAAARMGSSTSP
jgi:outer membrane protein assembly factor BamD (BamD/ComL family)